MSEGCELEAAAVPGAGAATGIVPLSGRREADAEQAEAAAAAAAAAATTSALGTVALAGEGSLDARIADAGKQTSDVEMAPIVCPETLEKTHISSIDAGRVDFIIKCTSGLFEGRFIFVNRAPEGELFGSDDSGEDVTMCIDNAGLSPKHAEVKFREDTYQYFLRDAGSSSGTWVAVRWNRSVEIDVGQELQIGDVVIEIAQGEPIPDQEQVRHWLAAYKIPHIAPKLEELGVRTMDDARQLGEQQLTDMVGDAIIEAQEYSVLSCAVSEMDKMFPPTGYPRHTLRLRSRHEEGGESTHVCDVTWAGGSIALQARDLPNGEEVPTSALDEPVLGTVKNISLSRSEQVAIGYCFGRYYIYLDGKRSSEPTDRGWVRLRPGQQHWLQPQDFFKIGSLEFQVLRFNVGRCAEQGRRPRMENQDVVLQDLGISNWRHCSFFAVYDGHGGRECSEFVKHNLHMLFMEAVIGNGSLDKSQHALQDVHSSLVSGFRDTDRSFCSLVEKGDVSAECGSAAVVACIIGSTVWCANVGDSRAVLSRNGQAVALSCDHKPDREDEKARIEAAGGMVSFGRVLGRTSRLAVSRAFGDVNCKSVGPNLPYTAPLVIAEPEIRMEKLTPEDDFLLLACDGLWDVFSRQEAVDFIHTHLSAMPPGEQDSCKTVADLVHEAIHERGTRDNVTAILVTFKRAIQPRGMPASKDWPGC